MTDALIFSAAVMIGAITVIAAMSAVLSFVVGFGSALGAPKGLGCLDRRCREHHRAVTMIERSVMGCGISVIVLLAVGVLRDALSTLVQRTDMAEVPTRVLSSFNVWTAPPLVWTLAVCAIPVFVLSVWNAGRPIPPTAPTPTASGTKQPNQQLTEQDDV